MEQPYQSLHGRPLNPLSSLLPFIPIGLHLFPVIPIFAHTCGPFSYILSMLLVCLPLAWHEKGILEKKLKKSTKKKAYENLTELTDGCHCLWKECPYAVVSVIFAILFVIDFSPFVSWTFLYFMKSSNDVLPWIDRCQEVHASVLVSCERLRDPIYFFWEQIASKVRPEGWNAPGFVSHMIVWLSIGVVACNDWKPYYLLANLVRGVTILLLSFCTVQAFSLEGSGRGVAFMFNITQERVLAALDFHSFVKLFLSQYFICCSLFTGVTYQTGTAKQRFKAFLFPFIINFLGMCVLSMVVFAGFGHMQYLCEQKNNQNCEFSDLVQLSSVGAPLISLSVIIASPSWSSHFLGMAVYGSLSVYCIGYFGKLLHPVIKAINDKYIHRHIHVVATGICIFCFLMSLVFLNERGSNKLQYAIEVFHPTLLILVICILLFSFLKIIRQRGGLQQNFLLWLARNYIYCVISFLLILFVYMMRGIIIGSHHQIDVDPNSAIWSFVDYPWQYNFSAGVCFLFLPYLVYRLRGPFNANELVNQNIGQPVDGPLTVVNKGIIITGNNNTVHLPTEL